VGYLGKTSCPKKICNGRFGEKKQGGVPKKREFPQTNGGTGSTIGPNVKQKAVRFLRRPILEGGGQPLLP